MWQTEPEPTEAKRLSFWDMAYSQYDWSPWIEADLTDGDLTLKTISERKLQRLKREKREAKEKHQPKWLKEKLEAAKHNGNSLPSRSKKGYR